MEPQESLCDLQRKFHNYYSYSQSVRSWRLGSQHYEPATLYPQNDLLVLTSITG
jgi:hypothetical protein